MIAKAIIGLICDNQRGNIYVVRSMSRNSANSEFVSFRDAYLCACDFVNWDYSKIKVDIYPDDVEKIIAIIKEEKEKAIDNKDMSMSISASASKELSEVRLAIIKKAQQLEVKSSAYVVNYDYDKAAKKSNIAKGLRIAADIIGKQKPYEDDEYEIT